MRKYVTLCIRIGRLITDKKFKKTTDMKQFLIFFGGMAAGALLLYSLGFRSESSAKEQLRKELIETKSQCLNAL
jgi:hypothetical protein